MNEFMRSITLFLGCLGLLFVLSIFSLFMGIATLPFHAASNSVNTAHEIIDKTINADNAIYNYEWFKQQDQDIKAMDAKVRIAEEAVLSFEAVAGPRTQWTFEDKTEDARLRSVALGNRTQYENLIADYNARASMANRDIFREGLIPNVIEASASLIK